MEGIKESEGKLDYELDFDFIKVMAERMATNKGKYPPYNWMKPMDVDKLKQAYFRHTVELMSGRYEDDNRKFGHIEAAACGLMMIHYQLVNTKLESGQLDLFEVKEVVEPLDLDDEETCKKIALLQHFGYDLEMIQAEPDVLNEVSCNYDSYNYESAEYLVLTDEEADEALDEEFENIIEEIIFPSIPDEHQVYFDKTKWKCDAEYDGRGHYLSSYDGREVEQRVNGTTYYLYRRD